jgi:hypothetical protein
VQPDVSAVAIGTAICHEKSRTINELIARIVRCDQASWEAPTIYEKE